MGMPSGSTKYLRDMGYKTSNPMTSYIENWRGWYVSDNSWYNNSTTSNGTTFKVNRISVHPARMVCQEWACMLLNEKTTVSCQESESVNELLEGATGDGRFARIGQGLIERAFALGTGAFVLRIEDVVVDAPTSPDADIIIDTYDADKLLPLSYSQAGCTECAFASSIVINGTKYDRLMVHHIDHEEGPSLGRYVIDIALFRNGKRVEAEPLGVVSRIYTGSMVPTFCLVKPALENVYVDYSPLGVSVFDDALGAVQLVDEAVDNMHKDIYLGQKIVFIGDELIGRDGNGKATVYRAQDQQMFRQVESSGDLIKEYNPSLRVTENHDAVKAGLRLLGSRCGLGDSYFMGEHGVSAKTATEVMAENSDLFRSIKKHENVLTPAFNQLFKGYATLFRTIKGDASIPEEVPDIQVNFDDSIIEDSATARSQDLTDVASGIMSAWEYRAKWYGESEEEARAAVESAQADSMPEV